MCLSTALSLVLGPHTLMTRGRDCDCEDGGDSAVNVSMHAGCGGGRSDVMRREDETRC